MTAASIPSILSNCDQEPIHIPGSVQPYAVLFALDPMNFQILQVSENCEVLLELPADEILGMRITELFESESDLLAGFLKNASSSGLRAMKVESRQKGKLFLWDALAHSHQGVLIFEVEPAFAGAADAFQAIYSHHKVAIDAIQRAKDLTDLCQKLTKVVQQLTGFDRVMIYRFDQEWNGAVIAEALSKPAIDSYLGQRFPSSDIPTQARQMLAVNWVRMIPTVHYQPAKLVPLNHPKTGKPLDLGLSLARNPSPIHIEYLKNMDVGASLTVSLMKDEKLWGLIACHHKSAFHVSQELRTACEWVGRLASSLLACKEIYEDYDYKMQLKRVHDELLGFMRQEDDFVAGLVKYSPNILDMTSAQGAAAAIHFEGKWTVIGNVPTIDQIMALVAWLKFSVPDQTIFHTNSLPSLFPEAIGFKDTAAGLLAISIPKSDDNYVLWFRPEVIQTVDWAGNPDKSVEVEKDSLLLHPRKSFNIWKQKVENTALPWRESEIEAAQELRRSIIEIDLQRQFIKEREARAAIEAEKRRFAYLASASSILSSSLDYQSTLASVARLSVESFCDWCIIYLAKEGIQTFEIAYATSHGQEIAERLRGYLSVEHLGSTGLGDVLATGKTIYFHRVTDQSLKTIVKNEEHAIFLKSELGIRSLIAVPMKARDQVLGVIEFLTAESLRRFSESDLILAMELGLRAGVAIDNALLYQEAKDASYAKEEVLRVVSHDLKNPVGAVLINSQLGKRNLKTIEKEESMKSTLRAFDRIKLAANRMKELIEDILDIAKIDSGGLPIEKTRIRAEDILQEAFDLLEPVATGKSIKLEKTNHADSCEVDCDLRRILQVISNLVGNAVKFTPESGRVCVELSTCESDFALFCVRDTGPGIPKEYQTHIFDRYWQPKETERQGTGLGLAIAKGIVEAHGGKIWVESTPGLGSSFYFTLPKASHP